MKSYKKIKKQLLKNKTTRKSYQELGGEFALIECIIQKRLDKGFTQAALAHKIGTKQSSIARLESGNYNPSLIFLEKIASALDTKLFISLT
ncbi:MAG: helix-turn-helix transcriptional regulator [Patescibacteria group bacterium]